VPAAPPKPRPRRPGFSLLLSLVVMAVVLLTVITVASFVTIESRLTLQHQQYLRARLNATVSLRLALAHLQQEAGPDRRMTARADILANTTQAGWDWTKIRNPLWTGVWRSDQQLQPPSWLVSGRPDRPAGAQTVNLQGQSDFYEAQWVPWQNDFTIAANLLVPLVGDVCASPAELATATNPGKPDGRISLPRIALPDVAANGSYCYWIGDEGVKARINLTDPRLTPTTGVTTAQLQQEALRGAARSGTGILAGLENMPLSGIDRRITQMRELPFLTDPGLGLTETTPPSRAKRLFTEATLWSRGVNCDSLWGGLKVDLSLAFEKNDAEWEASEFGQGSVPLDSTGAQLSGVTYVFPSYPSSSFAPAYADVKAASKGLNGSNKNATRIYSRGTVLGPNWEALRSYYRLYKELDWSDPLSPRLSARAHYPNARVLASDASYGENNHYSRIFNRADNMAGDFMGNASLLGRTLPRPIRVAASPYVCRQMMVWGLQDISGTLNLTVTPVAVLHNPYNVAMRLRSTEEAALRISFRRWDSLLLRFEKRGTPSWEKSVADIAKEADPSVNSVENFRFYVGTDTVLKPGELRIFSYPAAGPPPTSPSTRPFARNPLTATIPETPLLADEGLQTRGGFRMPCRDLAGNPVALNYSGNSQDNITVTFRNVGAFEARVLAASWPGDVITRPENATSSDAYGKGSELTTMLTADLSRSGGDLSQVVGGTGLVLPDANSEPRILAIHDYGIRWPKDPLPFPIFSHSNPLAAVTRADANGMSTSSTPGGYAHTSPSYKMTLRGENTWSTVMSASGAQAYGGLSQKPELGGVTSAVYTEVPLTAPTTLAQLTHANYGIKDQDPLLQIGNSYAPLFGIINSQGGSLSNNVTIHDTSWMINAALFDRFFFSGAAPVIGRAQVINETKGLAGVLDDFAAGVGRLANPRTKLFASRDSATVRDMLGNHRRIAGTILTDGTFNVNSTSVDAWAALLASAKRNAMGAAGELFPASDKNARFPRSVRADAADHNYKTAFNTAKAWTGLTTLDDAQIRLLARAIVEETRNRIRQNHRYEYGIKVGLDVHYAIQNRGVEVPLPYIGLSQFVNRFNCGAYPQQVSYVGCLENAIIRADLAGADISNRTTAPAPAFTNANLAATVGNPATTPAIAGMMPWVAQPANVVATNPSSPYQTRSHVLRAAPASLMQSDILAAVGSALSTRSDTFVIRCYGDATDPLDSTRSLAGCWIEAVVQRIPEFCDPNQPPETEVCKPTDGRLHNPLLSKMNRVLGRRFVILSARILSQKDL
jgi:hypothetical protein